MKKIIYFLIFFIFIFLINVCFYFISDDYRFFLKKIKNSGKIIYLEEIEVNDDFVESYVEKKPINNEPLEKASIEEKSIEEESLEKNFVELLWATVIKVDNTKEMKIVLWKEYRNILDLFASYDLREIEVNSNLFDITSEYPDKYYEYFSNDLTVYMFTSKTYDEIYDIFNILQEEQPFTLNKLNNFWINSFYINLRDDINDNFVRIVINNNGIVFWLKIKKDEYNNVKQKLLEISKE